MAVADVAAGPGSLATRVVVGAGLVVVACAALWFGGIAFTALVAAASLLMFAEWSVMLKVGRGFRLAGLAVLAAVCGLVANGPVGQAVVVLAAAAGLLGLFARRFDRGRAFWLTAGVLYCGLPAVALLWLRGQADGVALTAWVLFVVWATDIAAFFAGRAIGGARLAPTISPNKTVAGLVGGVVAAAVVGGAAAGLLDVRFSPYPLTLTVTAAVLALLAQGGDLFESWLKRRARVKDSGTLLPGHGGVLDRLDGLVPVAVAAALLVAVVAR